MSGLGHGSSHTSTPGPLAPKSRAVGVGGGGQGAGKGWLLGVTGRRLEVGGPVLAIAQSLQSLSICLSTRSGVMGHGKGIMISPALARAHIFILH